MKRFFMILAVLGIASPAMWAGKWDGVRMLAYQAGKHPEETMSVVGFLIDLFLMCIPVAIVAGVVSIILKSVMELSKEDTQSAFFGIGGVLLAISLLVYFLA